MIALNTPRKDSSWSRSLRDSDGDSCDDAAPPPRSSRQTRTRTASSDADGFTWGAGTDTVDIGLVSEPAGLKFVETPFTLAKRTDARRDNGVRRGGKGGRSGGKFQQPLEPAPATTTHRTLLTVTATAPVAAVDQPALHPHSSHSPFTRTVPPAAAHPPSSPTPLQAEVPCRAKHVAVAPSSSVRMVVESSTASTSEDVVLTPTVSTTTNTLGSHPAPVAPSQPHSSWPLHIRTDSPSPEVPSFQAPLLRPNAIRPAKPFVSPVRSVKQLPPPVKPACAPLAAPNALRATVLPVPHDTPREKPPPSQTTRSPAQETGPSQVASTPSRSLPGSTSKTRLERFRRIGTFSSTAQSPPPASVTTPSAFPSTAVPPPHSAASPPNCSVFTASASTSSAHQSSTSASASASSSTATTPSASSSTFRLPGLAPASSSSIIARSASRPASRLAFAPVESLAAFRARTADAAPASSPSSSTGAAGPAGGGRKRARDAASAEDGGGRERVVLGTAVRSVRPVSLASVGGSGRARGGGLGQIVGARAASRLGGAQDGAESGEARLRRLYRSLEG